MTPRTPVERLEIRAILAPVLLWLRLWRLFFRGARSLVGALRRLLP